MVSYVSFVDAKIVDDTISAISATEKDAMAD